MPESVPTTTFVRTKGHVHPKLNDALYNTVGFPDTITIQRQTGDRTPAGGFTSPGVWETVYEDIPARRGSPVTSERRAEGELNETWGRVAQYAYTIVLKGFFADITSDMRAVMSDGITIDIKGVMSSSEDNMTVLAGRVVDPGTEGFG